MSKIDDLVNELCPNGTEYKELGKYIDYIQPTKYIVDSTVYDSKYDTPVLTAGQTFILGYTNEGNGIYSASNENPVIIFDDFTTSNHWVNFKFKVKSSALKILILKDNNVNFRYLYYCIKNIRYTPMEHSRQWIQIYSLIRVPIPPIEVQNEIVRILDKFTGLEAELEAELEARKKQYEYYRDKLFEGREKVRLEELENLIISLKTGLNPRKNFQLNTSDAKNYYITVAEIQNNNIVFLEKTNLVNDEALKLINKRSCLEKNDVLFSGTGTIGRIALVDEDPMNWDVKEGIYIIKPDISKLNSKYLMYYLGSKEAKENYKCRIVGSPVSSLPMGELKKQIIPIPPLEEQQCIVNILDKFDKLVNDISEGLPAEIQMRRKQYEYYRNKLLNFKEIE